VTVEVLDDGRKLVTPPLSDEDVLSLESGDVVVVRGIVYAARDAAHKRMMELLDEREPLPRADRLDERVPHDLKIERPRPAELDDPPCRHVALEGYVRRRRVDEEAQRIRLGDRPERDGRDVVAK